MLSMLMFGVLGLIVGSFLNVLVLRRGAQSILGRSACASCGQQLTWFELIPLASYIVQRGSCRSCGSSISAQYPLVEATTAVVFALLGSAIPLSPLHVPLLIATLFIAALLIAIAVYDTLHTIIPDAWVVAFSLVALAYPFIAGPPFVQSWYWLLGGPLAALPLFLLWFFSRGRWMGLGDAKLALGIGWLLGPAYGFAAVYYSFLIGALVSVCILLLPHYVMRLFSRRGIARLNTTSARFTMSSEVPFGPFLIFSCFLVWLSLLWGIPMPLPFNLL